MNCRLTLLFITFFAWSVPVNADEVVLRRSVRIRHDGDAVLLADIARLDGEHAKKLADVKVARFTDRSRPLEITVNEVEKVLDRVGINRAQIDLSGNRVIVRPFTQATTTSQGPAACEPLKLSTQSDASGTSTTKNETVELKETTVTLDPRTVVGEDTVRGLVAVRLAPHWRDLDVPARIKIRTPIADVLAKSDARPTVKEVGKAGQGAFAFTVQLEGARAVRVIASIEVSVLACVPTDDMQRGKIADHNSITMTPRWVPVHEMNKVTAASNLVGTRLDSRVTKGEILKPYHFEPVIRRNDSIKVVSGSNGFALELDCISLEDGRVGQTIEVRTDTPGGRFDRNNKPIRVVVIDAGHAEALN